MAGMINFAGHLNSPTSIGIAGRDNLQLLRKNFSVALNEHSLKKQGDGNEFFKPMKLRKENPYPINFLHFNPDQFNRFRGDYGDSYFENRYNIGFWVWELDRMRPGWAKIADKYFDEIWTASNYCANTFKKELDIPVRVLPHPLRMPRKITGIGRVDFGIPGDKFAFFFAFDAFSRVDRKNPSGS